jgi:hypothetical protein
MLSLETAKALRDAGLEWEPQLGDLFAADYDNGLGPTKPQVVRIADFGKPGPEHIWLPRLDQLLAEIEKRGYDWFLKTDYCYVVNNNNQTQGIYADTPEEAAAQALLWILKADLQRALKWLTKETAHQ